MANGTHPLNKGIVASGSEIALKVVLQLPRVYPAACLPEILTKLLSPEVQSYFNFIIDFSRIFLKSFAITFFLSYESNLLINMIRIADTLAV